MFDMSWGEVMVIGAVALIVIGPKDLPKALRTVGQMTTKIRRMAGEFQSQFNEAMREAELDDLKKEIDGINKSVGTATATGFNPIQTIRDELKGAVEGTPTTAAATQSAAVAADPTSEPSPLPFNAAELPVLLEPPLPDPVIAPPPPVPEPAFEPQPAAEPLHEHPKAQSA